MIDFLGDVATWLTSPENWEGERGIGNRLAEHVLISAQTVSIAAAIALPAGIAIGHSRRWPGLTTGVVNIARAIPSFAVVALALPFAIRLGLGIGYWPTFLALVLLALPPIFTNAVTAVRVVDDRVVEAARGLGMRERELLWQVEIPLAVPLILAGIRVAAVQVVATATLGALVGWGGLGRFIVDGFAVQDNVRVFGGALLVALLAVFTELGFAGLGRWRSPGGATQTVVAR
ncbi:MAG: ABC transporter permease [Dehalococcoidia bacterium]